MLHTYTHTCTVYVRTIQYHICVELAFDQLGGGVRCLFANRQSNALNMSRSFCTPSLIARFLPSVSTFQYRG
jgi:hypothetical protein